MLKIARFCDVWIKCPLTRLYTQKVNIGAIGADLQKEIDEMRRIRPSEQPPKIWQQIEKKNIDGKLVKFTIQEIPEDRYEDAVQHMCTYFLADEPSCRCLNAINDPLFIQDMSTLWRLMVAQGISIAAFVDNPNGRKPVIAGMNALGVDVKNKKDGISGYQFKSENCKHVLEVVTGATKVVYEHYKIDKYLYAIGLSVDPDYRGYGLGKDILKIRNLIGSMYGVPATSTVFSSIISQKSAAGAGFEVIQTKNFADMVDKNGKEYFPGIDSKDFKVMSKRLS
ncbi:PREDICTED: uncharacterized protein LOC108773586 [Cyphomyrmex costatus]|uniref:N-acetyltransferase domain-containing protein n=1 Tax=Cyphomyrmex costatus TaxID=456900 RepID=A0A195CRU1_9HYME|nr:PREDICTED: uncharacterized protein LOC108773586 [Cyphomyrmex costatus]KYN03212.1 hypothetical protein ALC62_05875 [Cyphomyrmex costatus]